MSDQPKFTCGDCKKSFKDGSLLDQHFQKQITCNTCAKTFCFKSRYRNPKYHGSQCDRRVSCPMCNAMVVGLSKHLAQAHSSDKTLPCAHCPKSYRSKEGLLHHMQTNHPDVVYQCSSCDKSFVIESEYQRHCEIHNVDSLVCKLCNRAFKLKSVYKAHMVAHKRGRICKGCKKSFESVKSLEAHTQNQKLCSICNKIFCNKLSYYSNVHRAACEGATICLTCGEKFSGAPNNHELKHFRDSKAIHKFTCEQCGKCYLSSAALTNHTESAHANIKYDCEQCGKSFVNKGYYDYHVKGHTVTFVCKACNREFNHQAIYRRHIKKCNIPQSAWVCDVCGQELMTRQTLHLHKRIHTGEKPYTCSYCSRSFARHGTYADHLRTHTKEKPHKCPVCGKGFTQRTACKIHIRSHNRGSEAAPATHECCICGLTLATIGQLRAHAKVHGAEILS